MKLRDDEKMGPQTRLLAAGMLLDRGLGKAAAVQPLTSFSDEELVAELVTRKRIRDADEQRNRVNGSEPDSEQ